MSPIGELSPINSPHSSFVFSANRWPYDCSYSGREPSKGRMLKIHRVENGDVIFSLIGQLDLGMIAEIKELIALEAKDRHLVLDLKKLTRVDPEAVIFLAECEASGIELKNWSAYIREWIRRELGGSYQSLVRKEKKHK